MKRLISIIQFMTRIPIKLNTGIDDEFHKSLVYFPIVGLILGILYYLVGIITKSILPNNIVAIIIVANEVVLTGGLHLDGVGDSFDGLYSYRDKDRMLEIMKDSRLGTNGMVAIVLVLLFKITLTSYILDNDNLWLIIAMPVVARTMQVIACYKATTPRENGMGNMFIGKLTTPYLILTLFNMGIIMLLMICIFTYIKAGKLDICIITNSIILQISTISMLIIWTKTFVYGVYKKIDGITGDILGCISEISEIIYILLIVILVGLK